MIFTATNLNEQYDNYQKYLELFSSLSYLFSESDIPYIHYRIMENIFCRSFLAENISRTDTAFDASKIINNTKYGIGLKTFRLTATKNGFPSYKTEKIAEFNKESINLKHLSIKEMTLKIIELRNARLNSAIKEYNIHNSLYHCAIRYYEDSSKTGKIMLKEFPYQPINSSQIICTDKNYQPLSSSKILEQPIENLHFIESGTENSYSFNISKSTLSKTFNTTLTGILLPIVKIEDPFEMLHDWFINLKKNSEIPGIDYIILPLFSLKDNIKYVPEKSGLNQWNAGGRKRKFGEMYIQVPSLIHKLCIGFFPPKDKDFTLITPSNKEINVSLCQTNSKALMSNPNSALSEWFHPLLMKSQQEQLISYSDLNRIGKDCIKLEKISEEKYKFSLYPIGGWENFCLQLISKK